MFLFFLASNDTMSGTLNHAIHALAVDAEIQERLRQKIMTRTDGTGQDAYMNALIQEVLRMHLKRVNLDRYANRTHRSH